MAGSLSLIAPSGLALRQLVSCAWLAPRPIGRIHVENPNLTVDMIDPVFERVACNGAR
jgi:hypothetical protein